MFNDLYSSPNIVRLIKSRRMIWAVHVARMGIGEAHAGFCLENLRVRNHLGEPGVDGRVLLKCIFRNCDVSEWTGSRWLRIGTGVGHV